MKYNYEAQKELILNNPATHNWVKELIKTLDSKDICDVLDNLEMVEDLFNLKSNDIILNMGL
jgi:hypothetical protein